MAGATHNSILSYTVNLAAQLPTQAGFETIAVLVPESEGSSIGTTDRYKIAQGRDGLSDLVSASDISQAVADALAVYRQQTPTPSSIVLVHVDDSSSSETLVEAYDAFKALYDDFYYVIPFLAVDDTATGEFNALADQISQDGEKFLIARADGTTDNIFTTDTAVSGTEYDGLEDYERLAILWHEDAASEWADVAWAAARGTFDPDEKSAQWKGPVAGISQHSSALTEAQRTTIISPSTREFDANVGLGFGDVSYYVYPGANMTGRPIYEVVTADWYKARVDEELKKIVVAKDRQGEKFELSRAGQETVRGVLETVYERGVKAQHFVAGQLLVEFPDPISSSDISSKTLRAEVTIQVLGAAESFDLTFNFQTEPVVQ